MSGLGTVHFLGSDPICDGLGGLADLNDLAQRRHPTIMGPGVGPEAVFAAVLPAAVLFAFASTTDSIEIFHRQAPDLAASARRVIDDDLWPSRRLTLDEAISSLTSALT